MKTDKTISFSEKEVKELYKLIGKMPVCDNNGQTKLLMKWHDKLHSIIYKV